MCRFPFDRCSMFNLDDDAVRGSRVVVLLYSDEYRALSTFVIAR